MVVNAECITSYIFQPDMFILQMQREKFS